MNRPLAVLQRVTDEAARDATFLDDVAFIQATIVRVLAARERHAGPPFFVTTADAKRIEKRPNNLHECTFHARPAMTCQAEAEERQEIESGCCIRAEMREARPERCTLLVETWA